MNFEKAGIPTVCLITEVFGSVARAQQKALDYPDLPFVMFEHPVAVATDDEVRHKVELIYAEFIDKLLAGGSGDGQ